jgi:hypothetical protein
MEQMVGNLHSATHEGVISTALQEMRILLAHSKHTLL